MGFGRPSVLKLFNPCGTGLANGNVIFTLQMAGKSIQRFIPEADQIVSKTYMTRVEVENTRLRHYERSTASQNFVLLKI